MQSNSLGRFRRWAAALLLGLALLSACSPGPAPATASPVPTTAVLTVHIPGELDLLRPVLAACAGRIPGAGLLVFEAGIPGLPEGAGEVTLWLGEPPPGGLQAALLGYDEIVAAAPDGERAGLSDSQARALFGGDAPAGWGAVELWLPQPGQAARNALDGWLGDPDYPPESFLAPSASAMVTALEADEAAVGVLPAAWLTDELEAVYSLGELPVLALTDGVPRGSVRELIGCLQVNPVYRD